MASKTIDEVLQLQRKRREQADKAFRDLVAKLADGKRSPSAEVIDQTLQAAGKTVVDLEREIKHEQERVELRAKVKRAEELQSEVAHLDEQVRAAKAELEKARKAYDEATGPVFKRRQEIDQAVYEAGLAQNRLRELMPDDVRDEITAMRRELNETEERLKHVRKDRDSLMINDPRRKPALQGNVNARREFDEKIQRANERVAAVEQEHKTLNNRIESLVKQGMS